MMNKFVRYFFQGVLYIAPVAVTIYVVYLIFNFVDGLLRDSLENWLHIRIPGLGLVIIVIILTLIGLFGQTIIARPFKMLFNQFMKRAPIVKLIYSSLKDLLNAFVGDEKKFNHPVLVKVNMVSNLYKMGFITTNDLSNIGLKDHVSVYFPHSYNFSGEMFIVPASEVTMLDIPSAEAMKFIVSGGVTNYLSEEVVNVLNKDHQ